MATAGKNNTDLIKKGTVIEALPNVMFRVLMDVEKKTSPIASPKTETIDVSVADGEGSEPQGDEPSFEEIPRNEVIAQLTGKMRYHRIKVVVGDRVDVLLDVYDPKKGRVNRRL